MSVYYRERKGKDGKKRRYYFFSFRNNKKQITGTAPGQSHIRAEVAKAEQAAMQRAGKGIRTTRTPLLSEFIDQTYLPYSKRNKASHYNDVLVCRDLKQFFAGERLADITSRRVRQFIQWRTELPTQHGHQRANATINREASILSKILSIAFDEELIDVNPCDRVKQLKPAKHRLLYWSLAEEQSVMEFLTGERAHLKPIIMTFLYTGMRQKELFQLTCDRLDFDNSTIQVKNFKTNTERIIGMEEILRPILRTAAAGRGNELLFPSYKTGEALTTVRKGLGRACKLAGVKNIGVHGLRHTRGTRLALRGDNAFQIAAELGHRDIRTTQAYVHLAEAASRARVTTTKGRKAA